MRYGCIGMTGRPRQSFACMNMLTLSKDAEACCSGIRMTQYWATLDRWMSWVLHNQNTTQFGPSKTTGCHAASAAHTVWYTRHYSCNVGMVQYVETLMLQCLIPAVCLLFQRQQQVHKRAVTVCAMCPVRPYDYTNETRAA